ncbi:MAG: EAL domain-containing protein [Candidatus Sumerlaeaceae bacterium]
MNNSQNGFDGDKEPKIAKETANTSQSAKELQEQLADCQANFEALLNALPDLVFVLDEQGRFLTYHTSGPGLYLSPSVFIGRMHNEVMPPELCALFDPAFERAKRGELSEYSYPLDMPDGRRWYSARVSPKTLGGRFCGVVVVIREITEHKLLEERYKQQLLTDPVTNIANRMLFLDRLAQCVRRLERVPEIGAALLFADVDQFKRVNDIVGVAGGDTVLREIAARFRAVVRPSDTVARLGSDEFAVLVEGFDDEAEALRIAERLSDTFDHPFFIMGQSLWLSSSIGIVLLRPPFPEPSQVLAEAELAVGKAKREGPGSCVIYDQKLHEAALRTLELERDLRSALEERQLEVYYQPIVRLTDTQVVGLEALVRWMHPEKGPISPSEFIPVAEDSGLICALDHYVCQRACQQLRQWLEEMPTLRKTPLWVSVNFSPRHVLQPGFVKEIEQILKDTKLDPWQLKIEVTETLMFADLEQAKKVLTDLANLGVAPCLDDFGTGYSALCYLAHLPIRLLKMDISFVRAVPGTAEAEGIARTIVGLSDHLQLKVVAEGVETEEQAQFLEATGCQFAQGFLFGRAAPAAEIAKYLQGLCREEQ